VSRALLFLLVATIGCAGTDLDTEIAALRSADSLAQAKIMDGNAQGLMAVFADDAINYPPGGPIEGGETIELGFKDRFGVPGFGARYLEPTRIVLAGSGDLGYTVASEELTFEGEDGQPVTVRSRRLAIWKKQPNGRWQIVENIWNYSEPFRPDRQD
jgi:ketosteroid isomerase-like protein